jgi:hypothetical protein
MSYALLRLGEYRVRATYSAAELIEKDKLPDFEKGNWEGIVASNEIVFKVAEK